METMEAITLGFLCLFVVNGLLLIGLAIPLIRRRVKPNPWYGFRTAKTMSSEAIWYEANAYAGRWLLWVGIVFVAAAIGLFFVFRGDFVTYNITCAVVLLSLLAVCLIVCFRRLRTL